MAFWYVRAEKVVERRQTIEWRSKENHSNKSSRYRFVERSIKVIATNTCKALASYFLVNVFKHIHTYTSTYIYIYMPIYIYTQNHMYTITRFYLCLQFILLSNIIYSCGNFSQKQRQGNSKASSKAFTFTVFFVRTFFFFGYLLLFYFYLLRTSEIY